MSYAASVHAKAIDLTKRVLEMTAEAGAGHPTSAASLAHIVTILMYDHMRYEPSRPDDRYADRLVLSEGHACPIVYAAAADLGIPLDRGGRRPMRSEDLMQLRKIDSAVEGHPNPAEGFPFFPAATGSLGQGLSVAAGIAFAAKLDDLSKRVFCLIGDGESREGQIWEAVDLLVEHRLAGVCPIFNCNGYGQTGEVSAQQSPERLAAKLEAFGFRVEAIDGHDPLAIRRALDLHTVRSEASGPRPLAIVLRTVKGWGAASVSPELHGKPVDGDDLQRALNELDATKRDLGAEWTPGDLSIPAVTLREKQTRRRDPVGIPGLREALERTGRSALLESESFSTRKAYGVALQMLGHELPDLVALDGDVSNSTYAEYFAKDPELSGRFVECRIAEQNMVSMAAGLAEGGKLPFVSTFGKFLSRGYDQLEMALLGGFDLKFVGSHVGVSLASDGPSQMALTDVAFFRALSTVHRADGSRQMHVLTPADGTAAYALTIAMARHEGPCYLRTLRPEVPLLDDDDTSFEPGGHRVLREGRALLLVASGYMVHEARKASDELAERGIGVTLVDAYSIPFDGAAFRELAERSGRRVLTVEDVYGGSLGSAVSDALVAEEASARVEQMYVRRPPKSARSPEALLAALGLASSDIVRTATALTG